MSEIQTRIKFLSSRLKMVQECDWLEVVATPDFHLMTGRNKADANGCYIGINQLPGEVLSRWASQDLAELAPIVRDAVVGYLENKIAELEAQE